jgi:hypothetical protein
MSDNARLVAVIVDPEFYLSRAEIAAFSRRLAGNIRSPLVQPSGSKAIEHLLSIVDPKHDANPDYLMQIAHPNAQLVEVSIYGKFWNAWPGYRLLAEWLKHHIACEVFLGSSYGQPWMPFDAPTIARNDRSFIRMFCGDTGGSTYIGLPWPKKTSTGTSAAIAARFGASRFDCALKALVDTLGHHRRFEGQVPIPHRLRDAERATRLTARVERLRQGLAASRAR